MGGYILLLVVSLEPRIAARASNNLIGHLLLILLSLRIVVPSPQVDARVHDTHSRHSPSANETLGGEQGILGVGNGLTFSGHANQPLAVLGEGNY